MEFFDNVIQNRNLV